MPTYKCKGVNARGEIYEAKIKEANPLNCKKKLKANGYTPIEVVQIVDLKRSTGKDNKSKKNQVAKAKNLNELKSKMKTDEVMNINQKKKQSETLVANIDKSLLNMQKITKRDIVVFTQNFYLLKKAGFNNIHALSTVIQTTENPRMKVILEDILAGVEGRRLYVYNYGILFKCISIYLYKYG